MKSRNQSVTRPRQANSACRSRSSRARGCRLVFVLLLSWFSSLALQGGIITYNLDGAGRLTGASYGSGKSLGYTYDNAGNLTLRQFTVGAGGDSDGDGMDDAWELQYFGNLSRNGTGDFDGDGATDLAEFLAGTLPNNPASVFKIIRVTSMPGVSASIEWTAVPGKTYRVQYKNSPSVPVWSDLPGDVTAAASTESKTDPGIGFLAQRLYRVKLAAGGVVASPPVLTIARTNSQLLVSWASSAQAGFALESTTNLTPAVAWVPVTNLPSDNGTNKSVMLQVEPQTPSTFYRLRQ